MGITDRKTRQKKELRRQILAAAKKLFLEQGVEKTSIRNIADIIEYSPGTIYQYFADKDDILHHLHKEGFVEMGSAFEVLRAVNDPMERLIAMGKVYLQFAHKHQDMYDLMFIMESPMDYLEKKESNDWNEGKATFSALELAVEQCIAAGHFKGHEVEALAYLIWSTMHGMVSLEIRRRNKAVIKNHEDIVDRAFQAFVQMVTKL